MRSIRKAIDEYAKMEINRRAAFYYQEIKEVLDMSTNAADAAMNGIMAGFAIGYRVGRKDQKEGRSLYVDGKKINK